MVNGDDPPPNFGECGPDHMWAWSKITNTDVGLRHVQKKNLTVATTKQLALRCSSDKY